MDAGGRSILLEDLLVNGDMEENILQEIIRIADGGEEEPSEQQQQQPPQEQQQQQDEKNEDDVDAKPQEELRRSTGEADMHKSPRQLLQELRYLLDEEEMSSQDLWQFIEAFCEDLPPSSEQPSSQ